MENKIKKGTNEYKLALNKLVEIVKEISNTSESLFKTEYREDAELLLGYLNNYSVLGEHIEGLEENVQFVNDKIDVLEGYLNDSCGINYVKSQWFKSNQGPF